MKVASTPERERIHLRLSRKAKRRIEQAAGVEGKTVGAFIVSSALEQAENTLREHETIVLRRAHARAFFDAIANPPAPNDRLTAALNEHTRRMVSR